MNLTNAVLLAGGRLSPEFSNKAGTDVKALIKIGECTLLQRAVHAVREAGIEHIVVVGPEQIQSTVETLSCGPIVTFVPEGTTGIGNLFLGLDQLHTNAPPGRVLISATDLPFITADAVRSLLAAARPDAPLVVPILQKEEFIARFPEAPATYVRLSDGEWTSASVFLADPGILSSIRPRLESAFANRKSNFRMARLLGPMFVLKFLTRRLCIDDIERRARQLLGLNGVALRGCAPELVFDIDLPEDLAYSRIAINRLRAAVPIHKEAPYAAR